MDILAEFLSFFNSSNSPGWASRLALVAKNLPASAGDLRDAVLSLHQDEPVERGMAILESPMGRTAWQATVHRVADLDTTEVTWQARNKPRLILKMGVRYSVGDMVDKRWFGPNLLPLVLLRQFLSFCVLVFWECFNSVPPQFYVLNSLL